MLRWIYWDERPWFFEVRIKEPPSSRCEQVWFTPEELADYLRVENEFEQWQTKLREMAVGKKDKAKAEPLDPSN